MSVIKENFFLDIVVVIIYKFIQNGVVFKKG